MPCIRRRMACIVVAAVAATSGALRAAPPRPLPCATEALAATADIRALLGVLGLPNGNLNALESKLDAAEASIGRGNGGAAEGQLGALRNQIEALALRGDISLSDAQALLEAVDAALEVVKTCSVVPRLAFFNVRSGHAENTLFWVNPASPAYAATRVLYRTDTYPTDPADPAAALLGTFPGTSGAVGSAAHSALDNDTTYFYAAFAENGQGTDSAARRSHGRPQDTSTPFQWAYTIGRRLPVAAVSPAATYYALSNDALHSMAPGPGGGGWPAGWKPARIPVPADVRPAGPIGLMIGGVLTRVSFVGTRTGTLYGVNADTGAILWTSPDLGGAILSAPSGTFLGASFILFQGVERQDGSGVLYGLNAADGSIAWSFDDGGNLGPVVTQPAVGTASRIYFTSRERGDADTVWCLQYSATSAAKSWSAHPGDVDTSPSRRDPALYVANTAGEVHALDVDTGLELWTTPYQTGDGPVTRFVFSDRFTTRLYLSTADQAQALEDDGASARAVWSLPLPSPSVPVRFGAEVFIAAEDGRVYAVDAASTAPSPISVTVGNPASPSALGQLTFDVRLNILTVGSADGIVYALQVPFGP